MISGSCCSTNDADETQSQMQPVDVLEEVMLTHR